MNSPDDYLLDILENNNRLSRLQRRELLEQVASDGAGSGDTGFYEAILDNHIVTEQDLAEILGREFHVPVVNPATLPPDDRALALIDASKARKDKIFPIALHGDALQIAVLDPMNLDLIDNLSHALGLSVDLSLCTAGNLQLAINRHYGEPAAKSADQASASLPDSMPDHNDKKRVSSEKKSIFEEELDSNAVTVVLRDDGKSESEAEAPIIKYVQKLLTEAIRRRTSDIHLEPLERRFRVRFRIDGTLHEVDNPPKQLQASIISRLKLMANISIAQKRLPQDGRIQVKAGRKDLDLRVSSIPTVYGESLVMRILDKEGLRLGLTELGFYGDDEQKFNDLIGLPDGMILVTGPTGSGKSTTLYASLHVLNKPDRKIITVEDPVEYQLTGINQVQVNNEVGMSFSSALRAILRQAPNIIMIGEIRDPETAEIAVNASLTGHTVLSTLHTNDAPGAISRLLDIGIKPFLLSASLRGIIAQRLVRLNCRHCQEPYMPEAGELLALGINEESSRHARFSRGKGCEFCHGTGFWGRVGIFEILNIGDELQDMIYSHASLVEIRQKARQLGMQTLREDGMRKALAGRTTLSEVIAVTMDQE